MRPPRAKQTIWNQHPPRNTSHLIHREVDASVGDDANQAGSDATVQSSWPLSLQDLFAAVSHAPVLASAAQS